MESPIINEAGQAETGVGMQHFIVWTRDLGKSDQVGADDAFMNKRAFTGTHSVELNSEAPYDSDDFPAFEGLGVDDYGRTRGAASGYLHLQPEPGNLCRRFAGRNRGGDPLRSQ